MMTENHEVVAEGNGDAQEPHGPPPEFTEVERLERCSWGTLDGRSLRSRMPECVTDWHVGNTPRRGKHHKSIGLMLGPLPLAKGGGGGPLAKNFRLHFL